MIPPEQRPAPGDRVVVAMSGGVDSSVTAALLHERGCEVIGLTMKLWDQHDDTLVEGGCCTPDDILDARRVCYELGVPHYLLDYRTAFREAVVQPFVDAYRAGRTPNPCVRCNHLLKFDRLLRRATELGARWLATGHYAVLRNDGERSRLYRGRDRSRDQTYFLYGTPPDAASHLSFPLGTLRKDEVRAAARRLGVRVCDKPDSQDVCFIPDNDTAGFVASAGGAGEPGDIVDAGGRVLGRHGGVHAYTIGQRRGIGVTASHALYVQRLDARRRLVVVGRDDELYTRRLRIAELRWLRRPAPGEELAVAVRYRGAPAPVQQLALGPAELEIYLAAPVRAAAPGQAAVLYGGEGGDEVLGGGTLIATGPHGAG